MMWTCPGRTWSSCPAEAPGTRTWARSCAAPTLLGRWGLLEGKDAVCYPGMEEGLTGAQPRMDRGAVVDGKIITGRAAGSAFDFGLALVEALAGAAEADKVRHGIYY